MDSLQVVHSKTRRAYNLVAQKYHELFSNELNEKEYDRKLLDVFAFKFPKSSLLCDAGCGPSAHIGRYLFEKGLRVVGVDISDRCVELAREHNPGMQFERGDIAQLEFHDDSFEKIRPRAESVMSKTGSVPNFEIEFLIPDADVRGRP
jgi:ubiquinone/menaquinone biosynthesis C-methylase UbiE